MGSLPASLSVCSNGTYVSGVLTTLAALIVTPGLSFSNAAMTGCITGVVKVNTFIVSVPLRAGPIVDAPAGVLVSPNIKLHAPAAATIRLPGRAPRRPWRKLLVDTIG